MMIDLVCKFETLLSIIYMIVLPVVEVVLVEVVVVVDEVILE